MTEVSCRACQFFTIAERRGLVDLDVLLRDLPIDRAAFGDTGRSIGWDTYATIVDRFAEALGSREAVANAAAELTAETYGGFFGRVARLAMSPARMYDLGLRWAGPAMFRRHRFEVRQLDSRRREILVEIPETLRPCEPWFWLGEGRLRMVPRFLNLEPAIVEAVSCGPRRAHWVVTPPPAVSLPARFGRVLSLLKSVEGVIDELAVQQSQINRSLESIRRLETGFQAAFDTIPAFVAIHDDGALVYANRRLREVVRREHLVGQPLTSLVHPADHDALATALQVSHAKRWPAELRLLRADGETIHVEAAGLARFEFQGREVSGLFAVDITEPKRVRDDLRRSQETVGALVRSLPDLIVRVDRNGTIVDIQAGTGFDMPAPASTCVGRDLEGLHLLLPWFLPRHASKIVEAVEDASTRRTGLLIELQATANGRSLFFECRVVPVGFGRETVLILRDVTSQKEDEQKIAITERMVSVGTLAAGLAHEINNPLTYVSASLRAALSRLQEASTASSPELTELLGDADSGLRRVLDIVQTLNQFSRVEEPSLASVDVARIVSSAATMARAEIRHRARLEVDVAGAPAVVGDENRLTQVLLNLLVNAAQAMTHRRGRMGRIRVTAQVSDPYLVLSVTDDGCGIPADVLPRIFDPFFTTKPKGQGTGLGLAMSHKMVVESGGELRVQSDPGSGTTFEIWLPIAPSQPRSAAETTKKEPTAVAERGRVLVVDDEPLVARSIRRCLDMYDVEIASSADEALQRLDRSPAVHAVLCDIVMPQTDGIELHETLRRTSPSIAARFVFMSGGTFEHTTRVRIERTGCPLLEKPLDFTVLQRVLDAIIRANAAKPANTA